MRATEKEIISLVEETTTKLKLLIKNSFTNIITIEETKLQANKLIEETYQKLNKYDGYQEYATDVKVGLYKSFTNWYQPMINSLSSLAQTNEFASKVLVQLKQINLEYGDDRKAKVKGTFVFTGKDGVSFNSLNDNITKYMTSGEKGYSQMLIKNYTLKVSDSMKAIAEERPTLKDSLGRNMSLRNLGEMNVRFNQRNEILDDLKSNGNKLVMISQHNNASQRCSVWQGKVYSLDGSSGITKDKNHYKYEPLENATANHQLFGYNCRHRAFAYIENMDKPKSIPANQIKKEREIENTQRYLERAIISVRSKKELAISPDEKAKYTLSVKKAVSTYKGYCKKNDLVYEEWRTEI